MPHVVMEKKIMCERQLVRCYVTSSIKSSTLLFNLDLGKCDEKV
jgi:hypothetical protein